MARAQDPDAGWAGSTIGMVWRDRARSTPAAVALVFDQRRWSCKELYQASAHVAATLRACGLEVGDRVLLMMDNGPDFVAAFFGCQLVGVVPVPAAPRSSPERVQYMIDDSGARLVLVEPGLSRRTRAGHEAQLTAACWSSCT